MTCGCASERVMKYPDARSADSSRISPVPSSCGAFECRGRSPLEAGASPHVESLSGATALAEAARGGHDDVVTLLRQAAAAPELERAR
jgi:hypothetical protein